MRRSREGGESVSLYFRLLHAGLSGINPHPCNRQGTDGTDYVREGGGVGGLRMRKRRGTFRDLICTARGVVLPFPTRDDAAHCRGCLLPARDPFNSGLAAAPGMSSETTTRTGEGGDAH